MPDICPAVYAGPGDGAFMCTTAIPVLWRRWPWLNPIRVRAVSIKTQLSKEGRKRIEDRSFERVRFIDHLGRDPITGPVAKRLNAIDVSAVMSLTWCWNVP